MKLLVVDDCKDTADGLALVARLMGHEAGTAQRECEAWAMLEAGGWDALVADWWLQPEAPGGGGRLAARLRARGVLIPCAVVTGFPSSEFDAVGSVLACMPLVVVAHKPVDPERIIEVLRGMAEGGS